MMTTFGRFDKGLFTKVHRYTNAYHRTSYSEGFCWKSVLKICSKFTGDHPCRSAISINLLCNFIEIALRHGCSSVSLLHIFWTPFLKNTSEWLLLIFNCGLLTIFFSNIWGSFQKVQWNAIIWFLIFNCGRLTRVFLLF